MDKTTAANSIVEGLKNFQPTSTPFHLVTIVSVGVLIYTASFDVIYFPWNFIVIIIEVVLGISILFTLIKHDKSDQKYRSQLKFARSLGIGSGVICFAIAGANAMHFPELFYRIAIPALAQIVVFGFYIIISDRTQSKHPDRNSEEVKTISYLQLALITSAFLIGSATNVNEVAKSYGGMNPNSNLFYAPSELEIREEAGRLFNEKLIDKENESSNQNETKKEILSDFELLKIEEERFIDSIFSTYKTINTTEEIHFRKMRINKILFRYWLACIAIWCYFIARNLEEDFTFKKGIE